MDLPERQQGGKAPNLQHRNRVHSGDGRQHGWQTWWQGGISVIGLKIEMYLDFHVFIWAGGALHIPLVTTSLGLGED
jgi:hypothetical protein